jgi:hypothetical protein
MIQLNILILICLFLFLILQAFPKGIDGFKHKLPKERFPDLVKEFGQPHMIFSNKNSGIARWQNVKCYKSIMLLDESVQHNHPVKHCDFLYATVQVHIPFDVLHLVLGLSESVKYDRLKNHLAVRCHFMGANVSTILLALKIAKNPYLHRQYYAQYGPTIMNSMEHEKYLELEKEMKTLVSQNQSKYQSKFPNKNCK